MDYLSRSRLLLGNEMMTRIANTRVIIFGVGGVGSWCAECLVRNGIGHLTIVDSDNVCASNCNRQLMATPRNVGRVKVEALAERLLEINPQLDLITLCQQYTAETAESFKIETYDFVIDAIDSLQDKADLIMRVTAMPKNIKLFSSMGAALRMDPFKVCHTEFWQIEGDALARALRNKFKKNKQFPHRKFQCVWSRETPMKNQLDQTDYLGERAFNKVQVNGSLPQVTAVFGFGLASMVIDSIRTDMKNC